MSKTIPRTVYQEKQRSSMLVTAAFLVAAGLIAAFGFGFGNGQHHIWLQIFLIGLIVVFVGLFFAFFNLKITVTDEYIRFGFGPFKKRLEHGEVEQATICDFDSQNYFGYGIRYGRDKSWGYIAVPQSGVELTTQQNKYFITSDNPEQLLQAIENYLI